MVRLEVVGFLSVFTLALIGKTVGGAWAAASPYDDSIETLSRHYGVEPLLVKAMIKVESNFNPHAVSPAGARGLMQLLPTTAQRMGVRNDAIAVRLRRESRPVSYPLIESWHQGWRPGQHHTLEIMLIPQQKGTLRLFVRMALRRPYGPTYVGYPTASPAKDQQQWAVESYVIPIH